MKAIQWNEAFKVGIDELDEQHFQLVLLLNRCFDLYLGGAGWNPLRETLNELVEYVIFHSAIEEYWMESNGYEHLENHRSEHDYFISRIGCLIDGFSSDSTNLKIEIMAFLCNWLVAHILTMDSGYGWHANQLRHRCA